MSFQMIFFNFGWDPTYLTKTVDEFFCCDPGPTESNDSEQNKRFFGPLVIIKWVLKPLVLGTNLNFDNDKLNFLW